MESYCVFLMGNFVATQRFADDFGKFNVKENKNFITASWQSAFQCGGPVGALVGVFLAGPITSWIGYRWATIGGLMFLNGFIFVFYFANSLGVMLLSQLLEGIPWGIFIANAPAYCSEIVPLRLRAPATQMLQMFWAIGSIIVGGICFHYQSQNHPSAYRYVDVPPQRHVVLTALTVFPLRSNGCFPLLLPSSSSSLRSPPGGWCARAVLRRRRSRWPALDVPAARRTLRTRWP